MEWKAAESLRPPARPPERQRRASSWAGVTQKLQASRPPKAGLSRLETVDSYPQQAHHRGGLPLSAASPVCCTPLVAFAVREQPPRPLSLACVRVRLSIWMCEWSTNLLR